MSVLVLTTSDWYSSLTVTGHSTWIKFSNVCFTIRQTCSIVQVQQPISGSTSQTFRKLFNKSQKYILHKGPELINKFCSCAVWIKCFLGHQFEKVRSPTCFKCFLCHLYSYSGWSHSHIFRLHVYFRTFDWHFLKCMPPSYLHHRHVI